MDIRRLGRVRKGNQGTCFFDQRPKYQRSFQPRLHCQDFKGLTRFAAYGLRRPNGDYLRSSAAKRFASGHGSAALTEPQRGQYNQKAADHESRSLLFVLSGIPVPGFSLAV